MSFIAMRTIILAILCLTTVSAASAQRSLNLQDREVLEGQIEALEHQIETEQRNAQELRNSGLRESETEHRAIRSEIESKAFIFRLLFGGIVLLVTVAGFGLTFFGRRWIAEQIELKAAAKIDEITAKLETDAQQRLHQITENWDRQAQEAIADLVVEQEGFALEAETLGRTLESIKPDPSSWTSTDWLIRGHSYLKEENYVEAVAAYDRAIELDPDNAVSRHNRGHALTELGRHHEGIADYDRAIELDPDNAVSHSNRSVVLNYLGRYEEALDAIDLALELEPDSKFVQNNRGLALTDLGRYDDALAAYDLAIELDPDSPVSHSNRSLPLNHLGRHNEAIKANDRALELDPDHPSSWYMKALSCVFLGKYPDAIDHADGALMRNSFAPKVAYRSAVSLYIKAVAQLLQGEDSSDTQRALRESLREPFSRSIGWCSFHKKLTDNADIQATIVELNDLLRAHDRARFSGGQST